MMYRKQILLGLIELFGGEIGATDFQKLLFIFSKINSKAHYDFVPYKFGCFSFQAMADKNNLIKEGLLKNGKNWSLAINDKNYLSSLNENDRKSLSQLKIKFGTYSTNDLMRYVYLNYPYYAINSEILTKHLSKEEIGKVSIVKPNVDEDFLFTIGYEGKSLEQYLNILIQSNVKILCDVRKNPISRKYGFSKKTLQNACDAINIKYFHIPDLGINSDKRKNLITQKDYDDLFLEYKNTIINDNNKAIKFIFDLLRNYNRVALTCFEAMYYQCHRSIVAKAVLKIDRNIPLKHI